MKKDEKETYLAGIESYEGGVPRWLIIVFSALIIWGIYYLIAYWGGMGPGIGE